MPYLKQFKPLVIEEMDIPSFHYPRHGQNYYELVFIRKGNGFSGVNAMEFAYQQEDIFLVSPSDSHYFKVIDPTSFVFVKFTDEFLMSIGELVKGQQRNFDPMGLFTDCYVKEKCIRCLHRDLGLIRQIIDYLVPLKKEGLEQNTVSVDVLLLSLLGIVHDNVIRIKEDRLVNNRMDLSAVDYIHNNIYNPELLKVECISEHLHISQAYFGNWFKGTYHISYRNYVDSYKIELLKNRLTLTLQTLKEIAMEFNFSDLSHFSNYFYKHTGERPRTYRKQRSDR